MVLSVTTDAARSVPHNHLACASQWARRPASERFWNVRDLRDHTSAVYDAACELKVSNSDLLVACAAPHEENNGRQPRELSDLMLFTSECSAMLNHWSFGQLCSRLRAPASYLRTLPPTKAAGLMNYELERHAGDSSVLWVHRGRQESTALAFTSERYQRIPSYKVCDALLTLPSEWRVPPARPAVADARTRPATAEDVLSGNKMSLSIQEGDPIAPGGVYGDDRSMFAFLVNEERPVEVSPTETLYRGFYVQNSEVGDSALVVTVFSYLAICGNHIIWGCRDLKEHRIRHLGEKERLQDRFAAAFAQVQEFSDESSQRERDWVATAKRRTLGKDKDSTVEFVQERGWLTKKAAGEIWETAARNEELHGDPNSVWGFSNGVTAASQQAAYADARDQLDRIAARMIQWASN